MKENYKNTSDCEHLLWRMSLQDDEKALKVLFFDFYQPICVFANSIIEDREICRDIVQDAFFTI